MTSQSDRIQSLVDQINTILHNASVEGEPMVGEYQVLAQTRQRLAQLQQPSLPSFPSDQATSEAGTIAVQDWYAPAPALAESAQQVLQAIVQEMAYLRMNTVQPLREEITQLQQERNYLAAEVQQLQHQRYQLVLAQQTDQQQMINGFLHALMGRLQEQLTLQVAQTIAQLEGRSNTTLVSAGDAKVMQLDSTLQVVFDSLQSNINSHQASLEQSLLKMQGLGQQGEALFTAFVNRLASRLGQEASQYLQPSPSAGASFGATVPAGKVGSPSDGELVDESLADGGIALDDLASQAEDVDWIAPDYLEQLLEEPIRAARLDEPNPMMTDWNRESLITVAEGTPFNPQIADFASLSPSAFDLTANQASQAQVDWLLNQVIDGLENDAIAPMEAIDVVDNLDLGFGLDAVELIDIPAEGAALAEIIAEAELMDMDSTSSEQGKSGFGELINASNDADLEIPPISLGVEAGLDEPLQLGVDRLVDDDDTAVERLMDVLNIPLESDDRAETGEAIASWEQATDSANPLSLGSGLEPHNQWDIELGSLTHNINTDAETDANDVDASDQDEAAFLRAQLASELLDTQLDEQFFGADAPPLPESILPSSAPSAVSSQAAIPTWKEPSISFTIKSSSQDQGLWLESDRPLLEETDESDDEFDNDGPMSEDSDLYGAFSASIGDTTPANLAEELWEEENSADESGVNFADSDAEPEAGLETQDNLNLVLAEPDLLDLTATDSDVGVTMFASPDLDVPDERSAISSDPRLDTTDWLGDETAQDALDSEDAISDSWSRWIDDTEASLSDSELLSVRDLIDETTPEDLPQSATIHHLTDLTDLIDQTLDDQSSDQSVVKQHNDDELFLALGEAIAEGNPISSLSFSENQSLIADGQPLDQLPFHRQPLFTDNMADDVSDLEEEDTAESDPIRDLFASAPSLDENSTDSTDDPEPDSTDFLGSDLPAWVDPDVKSEFANFEDATDSLSSTDQTMQDFLAEAYKLESTGFAELVSESGDTTSETFQDFLEEGDMQTEHIQFEHIQPEQVDPAKSELPNVTPSPTEREMTMQDLWSHDETEPSPSSEATLDDQSWLDPQTDLFSDSVPSEDQPSLADYTRALFNDSSLSAPNTTGKSDEGLTPVSAMLDDLFANDLPLNESPASAQSIAKPIAPSLPVIADESGSSGKSLFDLAAEEEFFDEDSDRDLDRDLFDQDSPPLGLDMLSEEPEDPDGLTSLLQALQQDDQAKTGPLSGVEEAKTLADLLRNQNASLIQRQSKPITGEADNLSTSEPSDSDPFANWFGSDGGGADDMADPEKKNN